MTIYTDGIKWKYNNQNIKYRRVSWCGAIKWVVEVVNFEISYQWIDIFFLLYREWYAKRSTFCNWLFQNLEEFQFIWLQSTKIWCMQIYLRMSWLFPWLLTVFQSIMKWYWNICTGSKGVIWNEFFYTFKQNEIHIYEIA